MVTLRDEHPGAPDRSLRRLVVWSELRLVGESYEAYSERLHGPVEPLP